MLSPRTNPLFLCIISITFSFLVICSDFHNFELIYAYLNTSFIEHIISQIQSEDISTSLIISLRISNPTRRSHHHHTTSFIFWPTTPIPRGHNPFREYPRLILSCQYPMFCPSFYIFLFHFLILYSSQILLMQNSILTYYYI